MPEAATVEDVEKIYLEGWRLGLKALAIYRDNCKVGQPLSAGKKAKPGTDTAETAHAPVEYRPVRKRLPKKRPSQTVSFTVGGAEGYLTSGSYPDDGLGEIFVKLGKQGSTLAGVMDAFSMSISVGLQYGIPLEFYVSKFSNLRFEPAGMTDDPDVRIATSVMDYLFRRLALDYLPYEKRAQLGIFSAEERTAQVGRELRGRRGGPGGAAVGRRARHGPGAAEPAGIAPGAGGGAQLHRAAGAAPGQGRRRAAVHDLRHEDAPGRVVLPVRGLRLHQRLQLSVPGAPPRLRARRGTGRSCTPPAPGAHAARCARRLGGLHERRRVAASTP